jgi:UrcA family protein
MNTALKIWIRHSSMGLAALGGVACLCPVPSSYGSVAAEIGSRPDAMKSVKVDYGDLDLAKKEDQTKLRWRIHSAAMRVCEFDHSLDLACVSAASEDAWNQAQQVGQGHVGIGAAAAVVLSVSGSRE